IITYFIFNDTSTTEIYTLSLHDALPISRMEIGEDLIHQTNQIQARRHAADRPGEDVIEHQSRDRELRQHRAHGLFHDAVHAAARSEEHTSELQSRFDLVCRLLLEKKKKE